MISAPPDTIGELLHRSYASLAMAHAAVQQGHQKYNRLHFGIRKRLLTGLRSGTMNIGSLARDERRKMTLPKACCYCGADTSLTLDHLWPRFRGGADSGDNLVWACRSCNSSKGAKDVMEWMSDREEFPPLLLLRRHLKLAILYCDEHGLLDVPIADAPKELPFSLAHVPRSYPSPRRLVLWKDSATEADLAGEQEQGSSRFDAGPGGEPDAYQLAKSSVQAKRAGNLNHAIDLLRQAISRQEHEDIAGFVFDWRIRLAMYLQAADRGEEGWQELIALKQFVVEEVNPGTGSLMLSNVEDKMRLFRQREGRHTDAIEHSIWSLMHWAYGLHVLDRIHELDDYRQPATIQKAITSVLRKAGKLDVASQVVELVARHMNSLPEFDPDEVNKKLDAMLAVKP